LAPIDGDFRFRHRRIQFASSDPIGNGAVKVSFWSNPKEAFFGALEKKFTGHLSVLALYRISNVT
jgi:hypothetical protein